MSDVTKPSLYVVSRSRGHSLTKLGLTGRRIDERLRQLQTGNGRKLKIFAAYEMPDWATANRIEAELIGALKTPSTVGEWVGKTPIEVIEAVEAKLQAEHLEIKRVHHGPQWGGARQPQSDPVVEDVAAATAAPAPTVPAEPKKKTISPITADAWASLLPQIEEISRRYATRKSEQVRRWEIPTFPPGVEPKDDRHKLAMDSEIKSVIGYNNQAYAGNGFGAAAGEGMLFLGYTYLAELAQRPEYRVMAETIADDSTRKWIEFDVTGDEKENEEEAAKDPEGFAERMADPDERKKRVQDSGKLDRVKELEDDQLRLGVQQAFYQASRIDNFFGRSHLFLDVRTANASRDPMEPDPAEVRLDIGDATFGNQMSRSKVPPGSLAAIRAIEPMWSYPILYNANNPLRADWYNPTQWYVMGQEIHQSRLLTFVGHPVPDILKPAYAFGGLSLSQMAKPYVDIWLTTRQSVAEMIKAFSVMVLSTDLSNINEPGGQMAMLSRVALFNMLRDNQGLFIHGKDSEDFKNVSASLSGLDHLQAQAQEHMSAVSRIPLVKLTGISPSGLNATSEFEIEVYDDTIEAYQNRFHKPSLQKVINFEMLSLWGEIDPEITFKFSPLRQVSANERNEQLAKKADMHEKFVNMGAIGPDEVRRTIIEDREMPYADLNPDEMPAPPAEEGLLSGKGKGGGQDPAGGGEGDGGGEGGGEGDYGAGDSRLAWDAAEWKEGDHKRDDGGKFTAGSGGGSGSGGGMPSIPTFLQVAQPKKTNIGAPLDMASLQKVGKQMGSNPGGVYQSADGKKYYVKQGKTPAHVKNELIAGAMYHLAGTPTLKYRPVEGGGHIATEMAQLDKDNANKFDEKQRHEAKKDFAVHAWLGNWDAAGMGGDNLGIVRGKPTALDVGGAMEFRAQGAPKGRAFGDTVSELDSLRDKNVNRDTAKLFGDMTPAEMRESASFVTSIPDAEIKKTVEQLGGDPKLADKLIARKNDIAKKAETFGNDPNPESPDSSVVFAKDGKLPVKELNGVPFQPWEAPESDRDWANVEGQAEIEEPEFVVPKNKRAGTGVVIREPDGRVWLMRPKNGYGGYQHTFPKGGLERGLSPQANAIKEAYEETGLKAKITGWAGDHEGDTSFTRYYFAEREGGDPSKTTWESDGVVLSPAAKLDGFLNRSRDKKIAASLAEDQAMDEAQFEESKHPRGPDGKFTSGGGGGAEAEEASETKGSYSEMAEAITEIEDYVKDYAQNDTVAKKELQKLIDANPEHWSQFAEHNGDLIEKYGLLGPQMPMKAGLSVAAPDKDGSKEVKKEAPYGGLYVTSKGSAQMNHYATMAKVIDGPTQIGIHYRRMLAQLLKEGPKFNTDAGELAKVKSKLAEAWYLSADKLLMQGKNEEAKKALNKAIELGWHGQAQSPTSIPKPAPAPAPAEPAASLKKETYGSFKDEVFWANNQGKKAQVAAIIKENPQYLKQLEADYGHFVKNLKKEFPATFADLEKAAPAPEPPKPAPIKAPVGPPPEGVFKNMPPPTEAELAKAKKNVALQMQYIPGDKPSIAGGDPMKAAESMIKTFNDKYAGKTLTDPAELTQKVNHFKAMTAGINALAKHEQGEKEKIQHEANKTKMEAAKKAAAEQQKKSAEIEAKNKEYMAALGISHDEASVFQGLISIMEHNGGDKNTKDFVEKFKGYEAQAKKFNFPVSGFEYALIRSYINGTYGDVNEALRSKTLSPEHNLYVKTMNKALAKIPKYTGTVIRGTHLTPEQIAQYVPGQMVTEHGFTSTGVGFKFSGNVNYVIKANGGRGANFSQSANTNEKEVIFMAHTPFMVSAVKKNGNLTIIEMEEM